MKREKVGQAETGLRHCLCWPRRNSTTSLSSEWFVFDRPSIGWPLFDGRPGESIMSPAERLAVDEDDGAVHERIV